MILTDHIMSRRYRTRLDRKDYIKFIRTAHKKGLYLKDLETNKKVYNYLYKTIKKGYYGVIYNKYIIVFSDYTNVGITILDLPRKYYKIICKLERIKKEENNNAKR